MHEARQAMLSHPRIRFAEKGHTPGEDVYVAFGQTYDCHHYQCARKATRIIAASFGISAGDAIQIILSEQIQPLLGDLDERLFWFPCWQGALHPFA